MSVRSSSIYEPLKADEFRIVILEPGVGGSGVYCTLKTLPLVPVATQELRYEALSYAWGDPANTCDINIGGNLLAVTFNLFVALQFLRDSRNPRLLWVDAICIDQMNIPERSHQVQLMAHIYRGATRVIAWLGRQNANSDAAFDLVEKWAFTNGPPKRELRGYYAAKNGVQLDQMDDVALVRAIHEDALAIITNPPAALEFLGRIRAMGYPHFEYIEAETGSCAYVQQTFHALGERTYWSRRWVIQEFMNARQVDLVCGYRSVSWDVIGSIQDGLAFELAGTRGMRMAIVDALSSVWNLGKARSITPLFENVASGIPLAYNLEKFALTRCTDPRDTIYSLLNISMVDKESVRVDYNKPIAEVFADATRSIISQTRDLSCLGYTRSMSSSMAEVPSWIRDWQAPPSPSVLYSARDALTGRNGKLYSAAAHSLVGDYFEQQLDLRILSLRGVLHDTVVSATAVLDENDPNSYKTLTSWEPPWLDSIPYPSGENGFDAFWRTLQKDICHFGSERPMRDHAYTAEQRLKPFDLDIFRRCYELWTGRRTMPSQPELQEEVAEMSSHVRNPVTGFGATMNHLKGYCFVITSQKYMGVVHGQAAAGDQIFIALGSPVPFILRSAKPFVHNIPSDLPLENLYSLVGVAYIHGVMDGEIMEELKLGTKSIVPISLI